MQDFFDMGGYAGFVWPSYGVVAIVLGLVFASTWRLLKSSEQRLAQLQAARGRRSRRDRGASAGGEAPGAAAPGDISEAPAGTAAGAAGETR